MKPAERVRLAYQLSDEAAQQLQDGNDPASGLRLLIRASAMTLTATAGPDAAATALVSLATECLSPLTIPRGRQ